MVDESEAQDTEDEVGRVELSLDELAAAAVRSEHREAMARLKHLTRVLRGVRSVGRLVASEKDPARLAKETCRLLVQTRGFEAARVALLDPAGALYYLAEEGVGGVFAQPLQCLADGGLPACLEVAGRRRGVLAAGDWTELCAACPVAGKAHGAGLLVTSLRHRERLFGFLLARPPAGLVADEEERALFGEMAEDIGLAMNGIEQQRLRSKLERQLRQSQRMEAIGQLAGGVAHDFNNLLSVVLMYASFIAERTADRPEVVEDARMIREAGRRGVALTRQLLAFARKQELKPEQIDVNHVVGQMARLFDRALGEDVELVLELSPEPGLVLADRSQIEQVIMNLVVNARDAMPRGGRVNLITRVGQLSAEEAAELSRTDAGDHVVLEISDTGEGMEPETLDRIFEPFFTTKEQGKGTGLGLSTVLGIASQSGGHITCHSTPGQGTTFRMYLPHMAEAPVADVGPLRPLQAASSTTSGSTVLVVEDDRALLAATTRLLREAGYKVVTAADGAEALRIGGQRPDIDLLLTDLVLPGVDGVGVASAFQESHPGMPIALMSGYPGRVAEREGLLMHGLPLLPKPFTAEALLDLLESLLASAPR
jgi:two-component system, cell cycle sensor histidine kinase and response regulator CckA